jgi:hypothetical protein
MRRGLTIWGVAVCISARVLFLQSSLDNSPETWCNVSSLQVARLPTPPPSTSTTSPPTHRSFPRMRWRRGRLGGEVGRRGGVHWDFSFWPLPFTAEYNNEMPGVKANTQKKGTEKEKPGGGGKEGMTARLAGGDQVCLTEERTRAAITQPSSVLDCTASLSRYN